MSDYPLVALRVNFATPMAGIVFKMASLDHAVESAVGVCTLTFQIGVQLTARYNNNPTGTCRCNDVHSTHVAHQTDNWCFDSTRYSQERRVISHTDATKRRLNAPCRCCANRWW